MQTRFNVFDAGGGGGDDDDEDDVEAKRAHEHNQLVRPGHKWDISCHNHLKSVSICQRGSWQQKARLATVTVTAWVKASIFFLATLI